MGKILCRNPGGQVTPLPLPVGAHGLCPFLRTDSAGLSLAPVLLSISVFGFSFLFTFSFGSVRYIKLMAISQLFNARKCNVFFLSGFIHAHFTCYLVRSLSTNVRYGTTTYTLLLPVEHRS